MARIEDKGSHFDASLDKVWAYLQSDEDHGESHKSSRNHEMKPLSETSFLLSMEQNMDGHWVKVQNRITVFPPLGLAIEVLEGPMAGSKMVNIYTAKGDKTQIDVYGEFTAPHLPPAQLEPAVRGFLQQVYDEDSAGLKSFAPKP